MKVHTCNLYEMTSLIFSEKYMYKKKMKLPAALLVFFFFFFFFFFYQFYLLQFAIILTAESLKIRYSFTIFSLAKQKYL